jgi:hypothetical protein
VIKVLALNPFTNIRGSSISIKAIAGNPLHLGSGEVWLKGDVNSVLRSLVELPIFGTAVVNKGTWDQAYKLGGMSSASYKQPLTPSKTPTPIQIVSGRDGRIYAAIPTSATEVRLTALTGGNTALGGRPDFSGAAKAFFNAVNTGRLDRDQVGLSSKISMQGIGQNPLSPTASLLQDSIASLRTGTGKLGPGYLLGDPLTGVTRYREALLASVKGDLTKLTAEERMLVAKAINFESQDQLNKRLDALNFSQPSTVTALRTKVAEYDQLLDKLSKMDLAIAREKFPTSYAKAVIDEAAILTTVKLDTPNLNDPQSRAKFVNQYSNGAMPDELRNAIAGATLTNAAGTLGFRFVVGAVEKKAPALLGGPFGYVLAGAGTVMTLTEGLEIADSIKKYFALDAKIMNPKSQFNARELAAAARELTVLKCEIASKLIGMTYNVADLAITAKASARANKLRDAGNTGKPITVRPSSTSGSTAATPSKPKNPGATAEAPNTPVPEVSGLPKVKRSTIPKVTALPGVNNIVPFERFGGTSLVLAGNTPNPNKPGAAELYAALEVATGKAGNPDTIKLLLSAQKAPADPKSVIQIDSNTVIALDPKRAGHGLLATTGPGQKIVSTPIMVSMVGRQMVIKLSAGKAKPTTATSAQSGAQGGAQGNDQSTGGAAKPSKKTTSAAGSDGASGGGAVPPGGRTGKKTAATQPPDDANNKIRVGAYENKRIRATLGSNSARAAKLPIPLTNLRNGDLKTLFDAAATGKRLHPDMALANGLSASDLATIKDRLQQGVSVAELSRALGEGWRPAIGKTTPARNVLDMRLSFSNETALDIAARKVLRPVDGNTLVIVRNGMLKETQAKFQGRPEILVRSINQNNADELASMRSLAATSNVRRVIVVGGSGPIDGARAIMQGTGASAGIEGAKGSLIVIPTLLSTTGPSTHVALVNDGKTTFFSQPPNETIVPLGELMRAINAARAAGKPPLSDREILGLVIWELR